MSTNWIKLARRASSAFCVATPGFAQSVQDAQAAEEVIIAVGRYSAAAAVTGTKIETSVLDVPQFIATVSYAPSPHDGY